MCLVLFQAEANRDVYECTLPELGSVVLKLEDKKRLAAGSSNLCEARALTEGNSKYLPTLHWSGEGNALKGEWRYLLVQRLPRTMRDVILEILASPMSSHSCDYLQELIIVSNRMYLRSFIDDKVHFTDLNVYNIGVFAGPGQWNPGDDLGMRIIDAEGSSPAATVLRTVFNKKGNTLLNAVCAQVYLLPYRCLAGRADCLQLQVINMHGVTCCFFVSFRGHLVLLSKARLSVLDITGWSLGPRFMAVAI